MSPRILLVTTVHWVATARLAVAFTASGCQVDVVCPAGHPVTQTGAAATVHQYRALAPLRSLEMALEAAAPDLVVPCDDVATAHLHCLHARSASARARALIEASLGAPASFRVTLSRTPLMTLAGGLGIRVPRTATVSSREELREWLRKYGEPAVLKTDGSYGGRGVRIAHTEHEAMRAWEALSAPPSLARAIKRTIVNRDVNDIRPSLTRTGSIVNVQSFVAGDNANVAAACWKGTVLASVAVRVLHTLDFLGPASLVELIDSPEMATAVARLAGELCLSGLVGFDFTLEENTGDAHLIEMNPRATQTCHLPLGDGWHLPAALAAVLSGGARRDATPAPTRTLIALFPQEWLRDPSSPFLNTAYHDVPWGQPGLVRACMTESIVQKAWSRISRIRPRGTRARRGSSPDGVGATHRSRHLGETA